MARGLPGPFWLNCIFFDPPFLTSCHSYVLSAKTLKLRPCSLNAIKRIKQENPFCSHKNDCWPSHRLFFVVLEFRIFLKEVVANLLLRYFFTGSEPVGRTYKQSKWASRQLSCLTRIVIIVQRSRTLWSRLTIREVRRHNQSATTRSFKIDVINILIIIFIEPRCLVGVEN